MDDLRFDRLARGLAGVATRRGVVGGALAGLLGAGVRGTSVDAAERRRTVCREVMSPCTRDGQCCTGVCQRTSRGATRSPRYQCSCRPGLTACGRTCHDLRTDPENCGACGVVCESGECVDGKCVVPAFSCFGARSNGAACTWDTECCSLSCLGGVCSDPSVDCTTWSISGQGFCFRLNGQALGSSVSFPGDFNCNGFMTGGLHNYGCQTDDDCNSHLSESFYAPYPLRGVCLSDSYQCKPTCANDFQAPVCRYFIRVDEACV